MGNQARLKRGRKNAGVSIPISRRGLSKPLSGQGWRKDLLMFWLFQTCIKLQTSLDCRFLKLGMTMQEASVLLRCVEARRVTARQLAVALGRDKSKVTRFIDRLEASRLLTRDTDRRDRRFSVLKPTAKAKRIARDVASIFDNIRKELFIGILESDVRRLGRILPQLHKNAARIGTQSKLKAVRARRRIGSQRIKSSTAEIAQLEALADVTRPVEDKYSGAVLAPDPAGRERGLTVNEQSHSKSLAIRKLTEEQRGLALT
jgi:DNA-binding MarR family transcriptional regulator